MADNNIPNLDCMSCDDLLVFWKRYQRSSRKDARELLGASPKGYTRLACLLACYAMNKSVAQAERLSGRIQTALEYEGICERIYARIPDNFKW